MFFYLIWKKTQFFCGVSLLIEKYSVMQKKDSRNFRRGIRAEEFLPRG